jgi:adenylate cyclase
MRDDGSALAHARHACELAERAGGVYGQVWARACLGVALTLRGEWAPAIEALERAIALARERSSSLDTEAWHLARLAAARLGAGAHDGAREAAHEAVEIASARHAHFHEIQARIELARVIAADEGKRGRAQSSRHLDRAAALMADVGAVAYAPQIHRARAECALAAGDDAGAAAERSEAQRRLAQMSAAASSPRAGRAAP